MSQALPGVVVVVVRPSTHQDGGHVDQKSSVTHQTDWKVRNHALLAGTWMDLGH